MSKRSKLWKSWNTSPRDGTPFCIGTIVRWNGFAGYWEMYKGGQWYQTELVGALSSWAPLGDLMEVQNADKFLVWSPEVFTREDADVHDTMA